jgi:hypothetical protein
MESRQKNKRKKEKKKKERTRARGRKIAKGRATRRYSRDSHQQNPSRTTQRQACRQANNHVKHNGK